MSPVNHEPPSKHEPLKFINGELLIGSGRSEKINKQGEVHLANEST